MEKTFLQILNMGITAGYCVLVVVVLRLFLKKLPKIYSYLLWAVVYFRLVCPVSFQSLFSLVRVNPQTIPADIGSQVNPRITSGVPWVDNAVNTAIVQAAPQTAKSADPMQTALSVAAGVWIAVALLLAAYSILSVLRLKRKLGDARRVEENVFVADNLETPFVLGVFSPRIYLPAGLGEKEKGYVLAHERTHVRRHDPLIKQAAFLVSCVYWFHPLVWLAFYLMCRDMEMSCDESVIRSMGSDVKKEYSMALLSLASGRQNLSGSPLAFGEGGIKARITNVLHYKRPVFWVGVLFAVALAAVLLGLAADPKETGGADGTEAAEPQAGSQNGSEADGQEAAEPPAETQNGSETDGQEAAKPPTETQNGSEADGVDEDDLHEAVNYEGYLDESPYSMWKNDWNDCDFDADGVRDRIYRGVTEDAVSYRIEFGNGDVLDIGTFEDFYTGLSLQSADVDGDGNREILFVGAHTASTDPYSGSEIALFYRSNDGYEMAQLPTLYDADGNERGAYEAGWDIYAADNGDGTVTISSERLRLNETFALEQGQTYADIYSGDEKEILAADAAYDAEFTEYDGGVCLAFYENPGGKWLYRPVRILFSIDSFGNGGQMGLSGRIRDAALYDPAEVPGDR